MTGTVFTKTYRDIPADRGEILRYASAKGGSLELEQLLDSCLSEIWDKLTYRVCYCELPIYKRDGGLDLGFAWTDSRALGKNLDGCESIVLFSSTVGIAVDRLCAKYSKLSPSRAIMLDAVGTERIESLCDRFELEITERAGGQNRRTAPRFSPGYGDLPIQIQKDIFRVLDPSRKIGVTLNESMLISPAKSVTAIIGIK